MSLSGMSGHRRLQHPEKLQPSAKPAPYVVVTAAVSAEILQGVSV